MNIVNLEARDLSDAWFRVIFMLLDEGRVFKIDRGSYEGQKRLEFFYITIRIKHPGTRPLLPQIESHFGIPNPVDEAHLYGGEGYDRSYVEYLMSARKEEGESYTYGERLTKYPISKDWARWYDKDATGIPPFEVPGWSKLEVIHNSNMTEILIQESEVWNNPKILVRDNKKLYLNQIELLIWTYKNKGYRNNQMTMSISHPTDMLLSDPPCLRSIDTRIQNGKLHFFVYFRSWDAWGGFPENLAAIQELKEYIAGMIGVEDGEIIASSKGLHVYDYCFDLAKLIRMREDMELKEG